MDKTNRKIIEMLRKDGRASYIDIAEKIGVSEGTVRNRVEQMKEDGTIERFTIEVSEKNKVEALVMVTVSTEANIANIVENFPENTEIKELAGDYDLAVEINRNSSEQVNEEIDRLRELEGIESTKTYMVLKKRES